MKYIFFLLQLVVAAYLANYLSSYVLADQYLVICGIAAGIALFFLSSWKHKFVIFVFMVFFPLKIAKSFGLPFSTVIELISPVLCWVSALEILKQEKAFFSRKASIYFIAIGILLLWSILHYINNPVLGQKTFGVVISAGGIRSYYLVLSCVGIFLSSYWFFLNNEINADRWLFVGLVVTLLIGILMIIKSIFGNYYIFPFDLEKILALGPSSSGWNMTQYQSIPLRIIATITTALLISYYHTKQWGLSFVYVFLQLFMFLVLGGGRANVPAVFLSIFVYVSLVNRKYLFPVIALLLIFTGIYIMFLSTITFSEMKYGRAFANEGGLEKQSEARYYSFLYRLEVFYDSPVFGKGIGFTEIADKEDFFIDHPEARRYIKYIQAQTGIGGHGAYLSTLSIFGIGGFIWLLVMIFGCLFHSYRIVTSGAYSNGEARLALFAFVLALSFSITFTVGGTGYQNFKLWFISGMVAGLLSKDPNRDKARQLQSKEGLIV